MLLNGEEMDVNVEEELDPYLDVLTGKKYRRDELMANSPFREESNPSFSVNLETGIYNDFGGHGYYKSGGLVKLLSFLSDTPEIEIELYLESKYGQILNDTDDLTLNIDLSPNQSEGTVYTKEELEHLAYRSPYLGKRGISEKVQKVFNVGYDRNSKAVAFPWHNVDGEIVNVKFRSIRRKQFWYLPNGDAIKKHVYGLAQVEKQGIETAVITESEIDALYLWTNKIPAIALGSANMSSIQEDLINNSGLKEIVLGLDNDDKGKETATYVKNKLIKNNKVSRLEFPDNAKDINDIVAGRLKDLYVGRKQVNINFLKV